MNQKSQIKVIGYSVGAGLAGSITMLVLGVCLLGFKFWGWAEWEGKIIGAAATIAGAGGAAIGLLAALSGERQHKNFPTAWKAARNANNCANSVEQSGRP